MPDSVTRRRRADERRRQILDAARARADAEGWAAVTTRHLADSIGYSQPVLYGHFPGGKAEIMRAVALEGFTELAELCHAAVGRRTGRSAVEAAAMAYLDFAAEHPALYEAMFQLPIDARFARDDAEAELRAGFSALADVIGDDGDGTATEVLWGALHGMSLLERAGRLRDGQRRERVADLAARFCP
ncbi:TetR/AcrR family transcriptional regulator [Prauserella rugosa]|uniref:TetR family transcriptional regulator n=1 Tax=Prauserella rugosa TaxID=43354 RepID=A0A660CE40_9PSEU|nr:TetR/AcrR family transcriptional regulator [Prauserella rugosa]KID32095.1 transcriptional regulator, TetR family [Prauserella sp. Am3]KMS89050.1 TetR family transcriptional regulator [Streptomyces regensis]TWH20664.1 TetR family transcriptional regulator [Prauserella rugosa]